MIHRTKQTESLATAYYNKFSSVWQELDHYQHSEIKYAAETLKRSKWIEQERIFEFIDNHNSELDQVMAQILCLDPFHLYKKCMHVFIGTKVDKHSCKDLIHKRI